jgi:metal-responsive CopG/Arc/MetJ family transcriptional regulator
MKTIQITIEDELLEKLDKFLNGQSRGRSAFIRGSIEKELERARIKALDEQDRRGYLQTPIAPDEFVIDPEFQGWETEDDDWEYWQDVWEKSQQAEKAK